MSTIYKNGNTAANSILNPFNANPSKMPSGWKKRTVNLSPKQYVDFVANLYGYKSDELEKNRRSVPGDSNTVGELKRLIESGTKLDQPWLIINNSQGTPPYFQEGLHRMLAAGDVYGHDTKFPITLGYEAGEPYKDIENWNLDQFADYREKVKTRSEKKIANQKAKEDAELKNHVADYYNLKPEEVNQDHINQYWKDLDDEFAY